MPFLAHEHFGETYKWLLYGDDDTVWFVDGVLDLLSNLDPNTPYFITGTPVSCFLAVTGCPVLLLIAALQLSILQILTLVRHTQMPCGTTLEVTAITMAPKRHPGACPATFQTTR